jgi:thymidylate synthase
MLDAIVHDRIGIDTDRLSADPQNVVGASADAGHKRRASAFRVIKLPSGSTRPTVKRGVLMIHTFAGASADDLMRSSIAEVLESGIRINPSKGAALELHPAVLELVNPLARLSRTEARGRVFSALAETCWYLSRSNDVEFISYYVEHYRQLGEAGIVWGGYGARLFAFDGDDQVRYVIDRLRYHRQSRQAVIQLFDHEDVREPHEDVPCTCSLQYLIRADRLDAITYMRSNDVILGLPHDIFAFTMLQELIARSVDVEVGTYTHVVGSFHLYEKDLAGAQSFLNEGWQSTTVMPAMPLGDPWKAIDHLLAVEQDIRTGAADPLAIDHSELPYWADLERLLAVFALWKSGRLRDVEAVRARLNSPVYQVYVSDKLAEH